MCVNVQPSVFMKAQEGGLLVEIAMDQLKDNIGLICKCLHWNERPLQLSIWTAANFQHILPKEKESKQS